MSRLELEGKRFGRIVVKKFYKVINETTRWVCICDCGNEKIIIGKNLVKGNTKSCGCLARELKIKKFKTHGMSRTPTHRTWESMKHRCYNENYYLFKHYGGRGIKVCDRWKNSFENFLEDMGSRPKNKTIDRIDVNGNYEPGNCRWATPKEQGRNTRFNKRYVFNGKKRTLGEISEITGIKEATLRTRIYRDKLSNKEAFTRKVYSV